MSKYKSKFSYNQIISSLKQKCSYLKLSDAKKKKKKKKKKRKSIFFYPVLWNSTNGPAERSKMKRRF